MHPFKKAFIILSYLVCIVLVAVTCNLPYDFAWIHVISAFLFIINSGLLCDDSLGG